MSIVSRSVRSLNGVASLGKGVLKEVVRVVCDGREMGIEGDACPPIHSGRRHTMTGRGQQASAAGIGGHASPLMAVPFIRDIGALGTQGRHSPWIPNGWRSLSIALA